MSLPDWLRRHEEPTMILGARTLPVVLRRLRRARRFTLRLAPDGSEVRISAPITARSADAIAFARRHAEWLADQLEKVAPPEAIAPGRFLPYRGERLLVIHDAAAPRKPRSTEGLIRVGGPEDGVQRRLRHWLETEARRLFAEDLAHYCARVDRPVPPLALSNARRRWGSCSARGTIRLNWRLVMAPDRVRRSVVAHEVAHLVHFDHGPNFRALLATLYDGDLAAADAWLKQEGRSLYAFG